LMGHGIVTDPGSDELRKYQAVRAYIECRLREARAGGQL
jgi:hypothetical protein